MEISVVRSLFGQQQTYAWPGDSVYLSINQDLVKIEKMRWNGIYEGSGGVALIDTLIKHYKSQWICITFIFSGL